MSDESREPGGDEREAAPASRRAARVVPPRRRVVAVLRVVAWLVTTLLVLGGLFFLYQKYVLQHPDPTIAFSYEGKSYQLVSPRLLGVGLLAPWFLLILPASLADLPWPQRVMSLLLRTVFIALLGLRRSAPCTWWTSPTP
jgi:hypothetical protein